MMKWYLGGPMSGYEKYNFPAFEAAANVLRNQFKFDVISAHEVDHGEHTGAGTQPWEEYMRGDLIEMLKCDGAIFLQGFPESKGAKIEFDIACDLGFPIYLLVSTSFGHELVPLSRRDKFDA